MNLEIVLKRHLNDTFMFINLFFKNLTILPKEPIGLSRVFFLGNSTGVRNIRKRENKTVALCFWLCLKDEAGPWLLEFSSRR